MIQHSKWRKLERALAAGAMFCGVMGFGESLAQAEPGADDLGVGVSEVQFGSLAPLVNETGLVSMSIDGLGTMASSGTVQVQKPAGATTRRAFVAAASTGFSGYKIPDGGVTLDGVGLSWEISTLSGISSWNHWTEVTNLVKTKLDAAPAGLVDFTVGEAITSRVDGTVLAVVFDDPNQDTVNSVILMFGAQSVGGDSFAIHLSDPVDKTSPDFALDLSLGISYGYYPSTQYSIVKVNGTQVTTSAGSQDDGEGANGALLTVGGIGDTNANPPPTALPSNVRTDDELYSLIPFVENGDHQISLFSQNPSNDDNIFFAGLLVGDAAAIVGQGIVLGPGNVSLNVGETATATASVQDALGNPVANKAVTFLITAGPNAGTTVTVNTDASGNAVFSYVGLGGAGVDEITATFVDSTGDPNTSNVALRYWIVPNPPSCSLTAVVAGPPKQLLITVQNPTAGLSAIEVTDSTNATTVVPLFPQGFKDPLVVTATKDDQTQGSSVALSITDVNGVVTTCDPILPGEIPADTEAAIGDSDAQAGCSVGNVGGTNGFAGVFGLGALVGLALVRRRRRS
jgi:MYXO-CTERM domain-containing protein